MRCNDDDAKMVNYWPPAPLLPHHVALSADKVPRGLTRSWHRPHVSQ